jgi:hypothetical protein
MSVSQLSWLVPLHDERDFHPRVANLCKLLRYFLGILLLSTILDILCPKFVLRTSHFCLSLTVASKVGLYHLPDITSGVSV